MQNKTAILGIAAVAIIGIAVFGFSAMRNTNSGTEGTATTSPTGMVAEVTTAPTDTAETTETAMGEYEDGTYTAEGQYTAPSGTENVRVTVTLADGIIEDAEFEGLTENETSTRFQGMFAEGYKAMVVGKSIDEVELDKVSGSSLTPKGFNDAISKIKAEAQG